MEETFTKEPYRTCIEERFNELLTLVITPSRHFYKQFTCNKITNMKHDTTWWKNKLSPMISSRLFTPCHTTNKWDQCPLSHSLCVIAQTRLKEMYLYYNAQTTHRVAWRGRQESDWSTEGGEWSNEGGEWSSEGRQIECECKR